MVENEKPGSLETISSYTSRDSNVTATSFFGVKTLENLTRLYVYNTIVASRLILPLTDNRASQIIPKSCIVIEQSLCREYVFKTCQNDNKQRLVRLFSPQCQTRLQDLQFAGIPLNSCRTDSYSKTNLYDEYISLRLLIISYKLQTLQIQ